MGARASETSIQPNAQHQYEVTADELPLACPMHGMQLWNSHPRVYLPIEKTDRYALVLNRARARALGIAIPTALLHRADEVIG